jgi:hypothetical protein
MTDTKWSNWIEWSAQKDSVCPLAAGTLSQVCLGPIIAPQGKFPQRWCWGRAPGVSITAYRYELTEDRPTGWDGEGLPLAGQAVELHNDEGLGIEYGDNLIGEIVTVKSVFDIGGTSVAAVEYDGSGYVFRTSMLRPLPAKAEQEQEAFALSIQNAIECVKHRRFQDEDSMGIANILMAAGYRKVDDDE